MSKEIQITKQILTFSNNYEFLNISVTFTNSNSSNERSFSALKRVIINFAIKEKERESEITKEGQRIMLRRNLQIEKTIY